MVHGHPGQPSPFFVNPYDAHTPLTPHTHSSLPWNVDWPRVGLISRHKKLPPLSLVSFLFSRAHTMLGALAKSVPL